MFLTFRNIKIVLFTSSENKNPFYFGIKTVWINNI